MPKPKTYAEIADDIERRIDSGEYPPGSQLPSTRDLAFFYGVGATTINSAVRILRERGLIESLFGRGKFVTGDPQDEGD